MAKSKNPIGATRELPLRPYFPTPEAAVAKAENIGSLIFDSEYLRAADDDEAAKRRAEFGDDRPVIPESAIHIKKLMATGIEMPTLDAALATITPALIPLPGKALTDEHMVGAGYVRAVYAKIIEQAVRAGYGRLPWPGRNMKQAAVAKWRVLVQSFVSDSEIADIETNLTGRAVTAKSISSWRSNQNANGWQL